MQIHSVRLPDDLVERVRAVAEREDRSVSYIVRRALEQYTAPHAAPAPVTAPVTAPAKTTMYACPEDRCPYMSTKPGACVHHRTKRLVKA